MSVWAGMQDAKHHPALRFVVVGAQAAGSNVTAVEDSSPSQIRESVSGLVVSAVRASGG
jgi:hypothetical protein